MRIRTLAGARRWTAPLLSAALMLVALAPATTAETSPPQAKNGECLLTPTSPIIFPDPQRVGAKAQLNCIHLRAADAQLQLWRSAGAVGPKGDILLSDTGWTTWPILGPKGSARAEDVPCAQLPASGRYYLRVRVRSTVPGKTGLKTSGWVRGKAATLRC